MGETEGRPGMSSCHSLAVCHTEAARHPPQGFSRAAVTRWPGLREAYCVLGEGEELAGFPTSLESAHLCCHTQSQQPHPMTPWGTLGTPFSPFPQVGQRSKPCVLPEQPRPQGMAGSRGGLRTGGRALVTWHSGF